MPLLYTLYQSKWMSCADLQMNTCKHKLQLNLWQHFHPIHLKLSSCSSSSSSSSSNNSITMMFTRLWQLWLCESTRIDTHVDLSFAFGNERRKPPHNWPQCLERYEDLSQYSITLWVLLPPPPVGSLLHHHSYTFKPCLPCHTRITFPLSNYRRCSAK